MVPDCLQLGAKWPLESKCYFEACYFSVKISKQNKVNEKAKMQGV